jgi:myo-inositol-1(or 4)-monophosphatase
VGRVSPVAERSDQPGSESRLDPALLAAWSEAAVEWVSLAMARVRAQWRPSASGAVVPSPIEVSDGPGPIGARVKNDDPADWVTTLDEEIEDALRAEIAARFPDHGIDGEERGARAGEPGAPRWLLDPLDGTTNFVAGLPFVGVSVAVVVGGTVVVGVVADPARGSVLSVVAGGRPVLNGVEVGASAASAVAGGVVLTELVGSLAWPGIGRFCELVSSAHGCVRLCGSTSLSLAAVATGVARAAVLADYGHLDTAAAALAAARAGAVLYGPPGETVLPVTHVEGLEGLVVAAPGVAAEVLAIYERARADDERARNETGRHATKA